MTISIILGDIVAMGHTIAQVIRYLKLWSLRFNPEKLHMTSYSVFKLGASFVMWALD